MNKEKVFLNNKKELEKKRIEELQAEIRATQDNIKRQEVKNY